MYRYLDAKVGLAADSSLFNGDERRIAAFQTKDLTSAAPRVRVVPGAAEAQITLNVTTPYFLALLSDYPVKVRLNGASATQFTLVSQSVQPVNAGSPPPPMCFFCITGLVTSIYLAPISAAQQTANVEILVSGDPGSAYF